MFISVYSYDQKRFYLQIVTSMPGDAMEHWRIKVEPEEQVDATENAVKVKAEPENGNLITSCIDIEEHPVKLEEEQSDALICGLPAPDTEISDQEQHQDIGICLFNTVNVCCK
jgi:hypothetical protein